MLVLTRKPGEQIVLPHCGVRITVLAIRGNRVSLGITAPESIVVHREETYLKSPPVPPEGLPHSEKIEDGQGGCPATPTKKERHE